MMNVNKYLLLLLLLPHFLYSQSIEIKKSQWQLVGFPYNVTPTSLNLNIGDTIWTYNNGNWYCYKEGYDLTGKCSKIENIEAGSGFWIYSNYDYTLSYVGVTSTEKEIKKGWNLITLLKNVAVNEYFNNSYTKSVWGYKENHWMLYTPENITINGISTLTNIDLNQAVWVYATSDWRYVYVGKDKTVLDNGNFKSVTKSSNDDIENIWNISFKIDTINLNDFKIGVKFIKESTGAIGEIVLTGLNISNGTIDEPDYIIIDGTKSDGTSGSTYFFSGYNPDDILSNAVALNGNILTLKLGTIMKKQTIVSESTFKAISNYNIKINSDKLNIIGSKIISLGNITSFDVGDTFDNKKGIEGYINIGY